MAQYKRKDYYYKQAKDHGYRSRAAYKLLELDKRFQLFRRGAKVLDLGCFPGGWLQVALSKVGPKGLVVGVDLRPLEAFSTEELRVLKGACFPIVVTGDANEELVRERLLEETGGRVDLVLSDMSPQLSGVRVRDVVRSAELVALSLGICESLIRPGGTLVAKAFPGAETDELAGSFKEKFKKFTRVCLDSSRKSSNEYYFVGNGYLTPNSKGGEKAL